MRALHTEYRCKTRVWLFRISNDVFFFGIAILFIGKFWMLVALTKIRKRYNVKREKKVSIFSMSWFGWGRHLFNKLKKIHTSLSGKKKLFHRSQRQTFYGDRFAFQWGECETVRKNDTHSQKGQSKLVDSLLLHITKRWKKRTDMEKTKSWLIRFCHFESYFWIVLVCCSIWWSFISKFHHYFQ